MAKMKYVRGVVDVIMEICDVTLGSLHPLPRKGRNADVLQTEA